MQHALVVTSVVLKPLECEADHSSLSSAKVKNTWSLAASPHGLVTEWFQQAPHRDENARKSGWSLTLRCSNKMTLFVQYFIPRKQLYMFHPKHVELFAGNKIL
jgi:hypothetical protein